MHLHEGQFICIFKKEWTTENKKTRWKCLALSYITLHAKTYKISIITYSKKPVEEKRTSGNRSNYICKFTKL